MGGKAELVSYLSKCTEDRDGEKSMSTGDAEEETPVRGTPFTTPYMLRTPALTASPGMQPVWVAVSQSVSA